MTKERIGPDEFAVKLGSDISGGLGSHKSGTVLRNLSEASFNTLVGMGVGHRRVKSTSSGDVVDFDNTTTAAPAPGAST